MFISESSVSDSSGNHSVVGYDNGTSEDKKYDSNKAPRFNGDPKELKLILHRTTTKSGNNSLVI